MAMRRLLAAMSAGLSLPTMACADSPQPPGLDRSTLELVFEDSFDRPPAFWTADGNPAGRWKTSYFFGEQDPNHPSGWTSRTLEPNGELQYYAQPTDSPPVFEWHKGILSIVARKNPRPNDPARHGLPFVSGLITTEKSFSLDSGYVEARLALPEGKGLWPAFWLLPVPVMKGGQPTHPGGQEIDIVESIGEPGRIYQTVFTDRAGDKIRNARAFDAGADLGAFHVYGVAVSRFAIIWYVDDVEVRRAANIDFHRPAYLLLNLAVGGHWPGPPGEATKMPARLRIDWVRAYRMKGHGS